MNTDHDKQHAHELIERLEESQVVTVVRFLEFMMLDPVSRCLMTAPVDDEPLTIKEEHALNTSKDWFRHNQGIPHEEILAEFGLKPDDPSRR
ncbi:MAG TPA: hypothetical protein VN633_25655 [Bryobacteraceae bacterium]|nr:hypothetical protein [Bryobacteraceae bacterium]